MSFSFGKINVNTSKSALNLSTENNPLLYDRSMEDSNKTVVFLVDDYYKDNELVGIINFIREAGCSDFKIVCAINCKYDPKICAEMGVTKFYKNNRVNVSDYIRTGNAVVTCGPALYSYLMEDDIYPSHTTQYIFGKTNFWFSPDLTSKNCRRVFPIESFRDDIFHDGFKKPVDSFRTTLAFRQIRLATMFSGTLPPRYPNLEKIFIESEEDFNTRFYEPNKDRHGYVAWDTETSSVDFMTLEIGCITLSFDGITGYYIPWKYVDKKKLGEILKNNKQIGANLKFDVKALWRNGVPEANIDEDVHLMGHTLDETRSNSLKALAFYYSEFGGYERPLDEYKIKLGKGNSINYIKDIPEHLLREYAIMDAIVTYRVWENIMIHCRELDKTYPNEFSEHGMEYYYYTFRIPAARTYAKMEYDGVWVDPKRMDVVRQNINNLIKETQEKLVKAFGVEKNFQWSSGDKLGTLLEERGWEDWGRTKKGIYAVGKYQIDRWIKNHEEAKLLKTLASYETLLGTFVGDDNWTQGWPSFFRYHEEDNSYRMHPTFKAMMADSGRSKCSDPNMQQVPTRNEFASQIKSVIRTPDDDNYYIVTVDYSSLQCRLAAIDIRHSDDGLVQTLQAGAGVDLHSSTAFNTFYADKEVDIDIITVEQDGKTYTFYGGQSVMTTNGEKFAINLTEEDTLVV